MLKWFISCVNQLMKPVPGPGPGTHLKLSIGDDTKCISNLTNSFFVRFQDLLAAVEKVKSLKKKEKTKGDSYFHQDELESLGLFFFLVIVIHPLVWFGSMVKDLLH